LIKVGVIGGGINSVVGYAHYCAINLDSRFVYHKGFFSRNNKYNLESAIKYNISNNNLYNDIDSIISNSHDIECWLVLTPTPTHFDVLIKLNDTKKPVICEKALCSSLEESEIINNIYNSKKLYVIFNYTGYSMVREMREIIKSGRIGSLISIQIEMPQSGFIKNNSAGIVSTPQDWRLKDSEISTISLDLGVHLHSLLSFTCDLEPSSIYANANSFGLNKDIIDNVMVSLTFDSGAIGSFWYSKTALGHNNGLRIRIYGTKGSLEWYQFNPDILKTADINGTITNLDLSSNNLLIANNDEFNRFKPGHPTGFIEALANYYLSIYKSIKQIDNINYLLSNEEIFEGMKMMNNIQESINNNKIVYI
jgi:predicted dehydrogenase